MTHPLFLFRLTCALFIAICLSVPSMAAAQGGPAAVGVETVEVKTIADTVPLFAEVVTAREGTIASRIAGTVDEIMVLEGASVDQGEMLATLDTELLDILARQAQARLAEARAGIVIAQTRVNRAANALARIEGLRNTASFSTSRFDDAQSDLFEANGLLAEAEARVQTAEATLAETRYQLDRARITAPYAGIVLEVQINPGEFIASGAAVVTLLDVQSMEIEASVPSKYVSVLQPGQAVAGSTETGVPLDLNVRVLLPVEDTATRTRPVRFTSSDLASLDRLAIGQSITINIPISAPREVLSVPKDALVQARGGWTVFVAADGTAQPRTVQIGVALGDRFEVLDGLSEGDVVVTRGNERLRPGQEITPMTGSEKG
ncbi:efflux RND transporter periplasmic adaptor subunit [Roseobacter denitrificans]|uniref:Efflux transporter, RND family, MFP subunit n=1 Tax=Roseobacter denitrificans (strain ATCC 33942 / OCh 114) TaxID=375451 RepID=Q16AK9_ROSDO|nr:efflux RND transporter periplasmic adaptor subunit [Roseobacter denitrificans]ABG30984.1 efflux transporter, RND family, MFP subunit [Roseobacter denitrificans OCh 114]AVL54065.1 efflux RND transporter periplasmic adaptor subunit [Roseobacter denitrificans]SFG13045.1 RND family efflux transporter, MFP subunit [Roseobacter denitrificans OCh 114]